MLKVMRDSFQQLKWILVFIVFVFVLFIFVDWGAGGARSGGGEESYAARVNGETISVQDFRRSLFYTQQRYEQMYGQNLTTEMQNALGLPRQVLNGLVEETLLLQEARRLNLDASPEEVRGEILKMPLLSPNGTFIGAELYERYVRTNLGFSSAAAFEQEIARSLTLQKINSAIQNAVIVTPAQAEAEYRRRNESAKIRYALVSADQLADSVAVTPAEVDAYYRAKAANYSHPEQRNVKYLLADMTRIRSQIAPSEAELRSRYETTREEFKSGESVRAQHILLKLEANAAPGEAAAVEQKARDLVRQLRGGADFGALAREHSQDPGSAAKGGDLGFFERGQMVTEFEQAAFSSPIGAVTDPVKSSYGYHIIRVTEKRPGGYKPFDEVRAQLAQKLTEQKATDLARERIAQARARIDAARPKTDAELRAYANESLTFNDTGWFGKADPLPGLGRTPALNDWAFNAKAGDIGAQLETSRGPIIPFLSGTRETGVAPLEEVRQRVERDLRREKARELGRQRLQTAFAAGRTVDATAKQLSLTPVETTVTRTGFVSGLGGNVQSLVNEALHSEAGAVKGPVVVDQGALIFEVTERKKFDPQEFAASRATLVQTMQQTEAPKLRASMLDKLRQSADVEINTALITPAGAAPPAV